MALYAWQEQALTRAKHTSRLLVQSVTGAGKTRLAIEYIKWLLQEFPDENVLIIVPKIVILETVWMKELYEAGLAPHKTGTYYGKVKEYNKITITTTASIGNVNHPLFHNLIIDEIHNIMTPRLMMLFGETWKRVLGLSATIRREDHRHWELLDKFGHECYEYGAVQAILDGVISPLQYHDVPVDITDPSTRVRYDEISSRIRQLAGAAKYSVGSMRSRAQKALHAACNERNEILFTYLPKLERAVSVIVENRDKRVIVFNQRNNVSSKLRWMLLDHGIQAVIVNTSVKEQERHRSLESFRNGTSNVLLASVSLDEGTNIPSSDVAIILSGTRTERQVVQRAGRVLRKTNKTKIANVYQLYLTRTIEEEAATKRAKFFQSLQAASELADKKEKERNLSTFRKVVNLLDEL